jgi:hypothetical protein
MTELKLFVVYKLVVGEMIYIGSTCDLRERLVNHKSSCLNSNSNNYNTPLYKYIRDNDIDFDDIEVEVLEEIENIFLSDRENEINARKREQYYIDIQDEIIGGNILNDRRAYTTEEEYKLYYQQYYQQYYQRNKETIKENMAQYYQQNKETIKQYYQRNKEIISQKFVCDCGGKYIRGNKVQHEKTNKHQAYLSNLNK